MSERELTEVAQLERDSFSLFLEDHGCTCFISPPCSYCTHPGNPLNQENDKSAWVSVEPQKQLPKRVRDW